MLIYRDVGSIISKWLLPIKKRSQVGVGEREKTVAFHLLSFFILSFVCRQTLPYIAK